MTKRTIPAFILTLLFVCCAVLFCGCGDGGGEKSSGPLRDNTPHVQKPVADGKKTYGSGSVTIDASHTDQGYLMVRYSGGNPKVKLQMKTPDSRTYTYLLSKRGKYEAFPLASGSGGYSLTVFEQVSGDMYSTAFSQTVKADVKDGFLPFLYPNQYVWFTSDSAAVAKGSELTANAHSDLEAVEAIYKYIIENIAYDKEKAATVAYGYLPNVDETLSTGKGICFDYAALMSAMLRSQNIPTRLEVGYAGQADHAWVSVYLTEAGWVDKIIEFDGSSWTRMDPTFAAGGSKSDLKKYIGDGTYYQANFFY